MIELYAVSLHSAERSLLSCDSLYLERGTALFVSGDSGAGKSSFLNALHGSLPFHAMNSENSRARVGLVDLLTMRHAQRRTLRMQTGYLFQDLKLLPEATVYQNILLPLEVRGTNAALAHQRVHTIAEKNGIEKLLDSPVAALSASEKQLTALCRALVADPPLILADEPVASLDASHAKRVFALLREACIHGSTLLIASRNSHMYQFLPGARCAVLKNGRLVLNA